MASISPSDLILLLRGHRLRVRTGLWLLPSDLLGHEADEAARLGIDAVDLRQTLLDELPQDTGFSGLDTACVIELLDNLCHSDRGSDCILMYNMDLLLARLRREERNEVWGLLYAGFSHRSRALLIVMPRGANTLLPATQSLQAWLRDGRLAGS
jgi:hypothetical protein